VLFGTLPPSPHAERRNFPDQRTVVCRADYTRVTRDVTLRCRIFVRTTCRQGSIYPQTVRAGMLEASLGSRSRLPHH